MAFDEVRFEWRGRPSGVRFTRARPLDRVTLGDGATVRNARTAQSIRSGDLGPFLRSQADVDALLTFWEARSGGLNGFRVRDVFDWKSCAPGDAPSATDVILGVGDGATATFQLVKTYAQGGATASRVIRKPVAGTVLVAVAGVAQTITTQFTVNTATGVVTFTAGNIPGDGDAVTAGFEYDVGVHFAIDELDTVLEDFAAGAIPSLPVLEDVRG